MGVFLNILTLFCVWQEPVSLPLHPLWKVLLQGGSELPATSTNGVEIIFEMVAVRHLHKLTARLSSEVWWNEWESSARLALQQGHDDWAHGSRYQELRWKRQISRALIWGFSVPSVDAQIVLDTKQNNGVCSLGKKEKRSHPVDRCFEAAAVKDKGPDAGWLEHIFLNF